MLWSCLTPRRWCRACLPQPKSDGMGTEHRLREESRGLLGKDRSHGGFTLPAGPPPKHTAGRSKGATWPWCRVRWQGEEVQEEPLLIPGPAPNALGEGLGTPVLVAATEARGSVTHSS